MANSRSSGGSLTGDRSIRRQLRRKRDVSRRRRLAGNGNGIDVSPVRQWKFHGGFPAGNFITAAPEVSISTSKFGAPIWQFTSTAGGARWRFGLFHRLGVQSNSSLETPYAMERASKMWECDNSKASSLQFELVEARNQIKELKAKRLSFKTKLKTFTTKLNEGKASWIRQELQKTSLIVEHLKQCTIRERRQSQKIDILNSKLSRNLVDSKKLAEQFKQNYEGEKKTRVLLLEACNELAKEIENEKGKIVTLKSECEQMVEKVEGERKMLQMFETWNEERVQMKLANAAMIFETKYCEMSNITIEVEKFLRCLNVKKHIATKSKVEVEWINSSPISHSSVITRSTTDMHSSDKQGDNHIEDNESRKLEISEVSSVLSKQPKKSGPLGRKLWRTSNDWNARCLDRSLSNVSSISQERVCDEGAVFCPPKARNPHVDRAMQGCIKWREGIQKQGSRRKRLEVKLVTQKMRLQSILKKRREDK